MSKINYEQKIKLLLKPLPRELCVTFALYCAKDARQCTDPKNLVLIDKALDLVEKWLKDKNSVTQKELIDAAKTAYAMSYHAAVYAVYAPAHANYVAANAAVYAAHAAAYAAHAAANQNKLKEYYEYLLEMINDLTKLEKVIYGLDFN